MLLRLRRDFFQNCQCFCLSEQVCTLRYTQAESILLFSQISVTRQISTDFWYRSRLKLVEAPGFLRDLVFISIILHLNDF